MIRLFDIIFSLAGILVGAPLFLIVYVVGLFDTGSPVFMQSRLGKNKKPFTLIKFRTMKAATDSVASHLVDHNAITKVGRFLRKTKLDELPQLINVLFGHMSLVGPRPNLSSQTVLIQERDSLGVYSVRPGVTGLAQLSGVDMSTPKKLSEIDAQMLADLSVSTYFKYIFLTSLGKGAGDAVKGVEK
ncbi:sugar transferase [Pseudomonas sp. HK3]